jgi:3-oxoacyl-[acyl-carrier-protein] synthase-3
MKGQQRIAILGVGHCLPETVRSNDDPVFAYLRAHPQPNSDLFAGLKYRRVLLDGETLLSIMVPAAQRALDSAGLKAADVGMLLGSASVGEYYAPNGLSEVHHALGLAPGCRVMGLNTEYSTFLDAMKIANDMIACGTIGNALVVSGINWTRHMDYHESVSVAASDAAGAAVVGMSDDPRKFVLVDWENETDSSLFSAFRMAARPAQTDAQTDDPVRQPQTYTTDLMKIDDTIGRGAVLNFGIPAPPRILATLLARNSLAPENITVVAHQTSKFVADQWKAAMKPALYVSTLEDLADMVSASVPVNLSMHFDAIPTDHIVLIGIGMEMHATAMLYSRASV